MSIGIDDKVSSIDPSCNPNLLVLNWTSADDRDFGELVLSWEQWDDLQGDVRAVRRRHAPDTIPPTQRSEFEELFNLYQKGAVDIDKIYEHLREDMLRATGSTE